MTFFAESQIQPHNSIGNELAPVFSSTLERGYKIYLNTVKSFSTIIYIITTDLQGCRVGVTIDMNKHNCY